LHRRESYIQKAHHRDCVESRLRHEIILHILTLNGLAELCQPILRKYIAKNSYHDQAKSSVDGLGHDFDVFQFQYHVDEQLTRGSSLSAVRQQWS